MVLGTQPILGSVAPGAFRAFHQNSLNVLSVLERSVRSERCVSERSMGRRRRPLILARARFDCSHLIVALVRPRL